jgi:hypothetical protein
MMPKDAVAAIAAFSERSNRSLNVRYFFIALFRTKHGSAHWAGQGSPFEKSTVTGELVATLMEENPTSACLRRMKPLALAGSGFRQPRGSGCPELSFGSIRSSQLLISDWY